MCHQAINWAKESYKAEDDWAKFKPSFLVIMRMLCIEVAINLFLQNSTWNANILIPFPTWMSSDIMMRLTDCLYTRQVKVEMAKSQIFVKIG